MVSSRVDELSKDAKARRTAIEKRVAALQAEAQKFVTENVETATGTYEQLAKRGEKVVKRIRKETAAVADPGPVKKTTGATHQVDDRQVDHRQEGAGQEDRQEGSGQEDRRQVTL